MRDLTEFSTFKLDPITKGTGSDVRMACSGVVMRPLHQLAACPAPTLEILTETLGSVKMVLRGIVIIDKNKDALVSRPVKISFQDLDHNPPR